ncbi:MAG: ribosome maturation factor RimP, partial [Acidiferrobacteraceae bacterium]
VRTSGRYCPLCVYGTGNMLRNMERVRAVIEPAVRALGYELVDVELAGQGRNALLRIYIDHPEGVTVEDCAAASRQVSAALDVEDPIPGRYTLEVSSPGLDRPLRRQEDFTRFKGALVRVRTVAPIMGRRNFTGRLLGYEREHVVLEADAERYELALANIDTARLVPEL